MIGDYAVVNVTGLDVRGGALGRALHLHGPSSRVNLTGVHAPGLPSFVRSSELDLRGCVLPLAPASARPR